MPVNKQFSDDLVAGAAIRDGEGNIISSSYAPATILVDQCNLWELDIGLYKATVDSSTSGFHIYFTSSSQTPLLDGTVFQVSRIDTSDTKTIMLPIQGESDGTDFCAMYYIWSKSSTEGNLAVYVIPQPDASSHFLDTIVTGSLIEPIILTLSSNIDAVSTSLSGKEDVSNKVTTLSSTNTDTQYPSAKCVYDLIGDINIILAQLTTITA